MTRLTATEITPAAVAAAAAASNNISAWVFAQHSANQSVGGYLRC